MKWHIRAVSALLVPCVILSACGEKEIKELLVSGAKSAVAVMNRISQASLKSNRPSANLGIYAGIYMTQGTSLPAKTAMRGIEALSRMIAAQASSSTSENYALLIEVGEVLQVDIVDLLNRSENRAKVIEQYIQSLKNTGILIERKITELSALEETQEDELRVRRKAFRDIEKQISEALKQQDYGTAGSLEESLAEAKSLHAELETKEKQTQDMIKRLNVLLDIAISRLQAVENNREILIAGLRVINVPGISDLNILEEGKAWRKKQTEDIFGRPR